MTILEKKKNKKIKKNIWGKLKLDYQPTQYWKINLIKIIFKNNIWGNTAAKQKLCRGKTITIHIVFFLKKTTKLNSQPT